MAACHGIARHRQPQGAITPNRGLFGDLAGNERFVTAYQKALASLHQNGARATLQSLV